MILQDFVAAGACQVFSFAPSDHCPAQTRFFSFNIQPIQAGIRDRCITGAGQGPPHGTAIKQIQHPAMGDQDDGMIGLLARQIPKGVLNTFEHSL